MTLQIRRVEGDKKTMRAFLDVVDHVYAEDPHYVRPLDMDVGDRLDKKKNPFFDHGDAAAWVAFAGDTPVGRVSASIDEEHLRLYNDDVGFSGSSTPSTTPTWRVRCWTPPTAGCVSAT